ncbi:MarR family winged helix-turn-helix transcriptional regulator [Microbacterium sp. SSM24]|uniref:MarR family winged helix-turn-helix transcriptional regulator n=1 Tax=Microbacterium sp. SSM24 TaxID=2991714 RepID=UPI0022260E24|nr:MarR family transcriptional regulator [Microbacterium sp. SSM24]MCW3492664.1 MarR family transcriptional regulator [Microbacterium sp. SSM24]
MDYFSRLVSYETHLWNRLERALIAAGGESMANVMALRILDRHGGRGRVHELSDELGITMGAASKLTDRLERSGLALRRPHPADRRSSLITLTEAGRRALNEAVQVVDPVLGELLPGPEDLAAAEATLAQLEKRLVDASTTIATGR